MNATIKKDTGQSTPQEDRTTSQKKSATSQEDRTTSQRDRLTPRLTGAMSVFAMKVTKAAGSTSAFITALSLVALWGLTGRFFHYSQNWELVINTGTSVITFLMVFLIQKSQNKDSLAIQLKLNELLAAHEYASNRLVNVESMSEEELRVIQKYYSRVSGIEDPANLWKAHSTAASKSPQDLNEESRELLDMKNELENRIKDTIEKDKGKAK